MNHKNRRDFIKHSSLLSVSVSMGILPNILTKQSFKSPHLKKNWAHFIQKMSRESVSFVLDKNIFLSETHSADCSEFRFVWGEPVLFKNSNVVARPLWQFWQTSQTPLDVTILFWEKKENWEYITTVNRLEMKTLAQLSDDFTEGVLMPRLGKKTLDFMGHHTAKGKMLMKTIHDKNVFTHVKIWDNGSRIADKKIILSHFNNLI